jgi:4-amino-4-deoxy-L-arabinose transferase-like glycosyltransferase
VIILLLTLILALAAGVRFYALDSQSLWADEGNSAALATRSLVQIGRDAAHDIHPPLYYWLLHLWTRVAGTGEVGLRSFSALLGALLVLTVGGVGRRLFSTGVGLAGAFIAALAPFQVYYSQEARMYILLALLAAIAVYLFCWFVSQEDQRLPRGEELRPVRLRRLPFSAQLLTLVWAAGLYTHYAFPLMIGLLTLVYLGWIVVSRRRGLVGQRLLRWGLMLALTLGFYAPWLSTAIRQVTTWPTGGLAVNSVTAIKTSLAWLAVGPLGQDQPDVWWIWVLSALALIGALPWPAKGRWPTLRYAQGEPLRHAQGEPLRYAPWPRPASPSPPLRGETGQGEQWLGWLIPLAWVGAPLGMMLALGLFRPAYLKFLLIASPAYSLLLARAAIVPHLALNLFASRRAPTSQRALFPLWSVVGGIWALSVLALIAAVSALALVRYYNDPRLARDDYRGIVQFITATAQPNDAILLDAPGQAEVVNYYYPGELPIYPLPRQRPLEPEATLRELSRLLDHDKVYAIYWATDEADPGGLIEGWMNNHGYKTLDQWRGNVRLAVYVMPEHRAPDEIVDTLNLRLGADIVLVGYRGWNLKPTAGEATHLQLVWRADRAPARRYKAFLQLLDSRDQVVAQRDAEPAGDSRPTDTWEPGETILDNHGLLIPPGTPPGTYRRIVGLYDRETGERLRLPDGTDFINLAPVTVARTSIPPPLAALNMQYAQSFDFGGITLLGHDRYKRGFGHAPNTPLCPGDRLHLTFYWRANIQPRADWWFDLTLSDSHGEEVANLQAPLVGQTYATTLWEAGEIVRGEHDLLIPADLPPGTYWLSLTLLPDTLTPAGVAYLGTMKVTKPVEK